MQRSRVALKAVPVTPEIDLPFLPFVFDISMAVRRGDPLKERLDDVIARRRTEIDALLRRYGLPRADGPIATEAQKSDGRSAQRAGKNIPNSARGPA
jgi:hypothetical protein